MASQEFNGTFCEGIALEEYNGIFWEDMASKEFNGKFCGGGGCPRMYWYILIGDGLTGI